MNTCGMSDQVRDTRPPAKRRAASFSGILRQRGQVLVSLALSLFDLSSGHACKNETFAPRAHFEPRDQGGADPLTFSLLLGESTDLLRAES